jgi:hypothetical protein
VVGQNAEVISTSADRRIGEGVEAVPDFGVQSDSDVVVRIDLGGEQVQMDDLGVAARVDPDRGELLGPRYEGCQVP